MQLSTSYSNTPPGRSKGEMVGTPLKIFTGLENGLNLQGKRELVGSQVTECVSGADVYLALEKWQIQMGKLSA